VKNNFVKLLIVVLFGFMLNCQIISASFLSRAHSNLPSYDYNDNDGLNSGSHVTIFASYLDSDNYLHCYYAFPNNFPSEYGIASEKCFLYYKQYYNSEPVVKFICDTYKITIEGEAVDFTVMDSCDKEMPPTPNQIYKLANTQNTFCLNGKTISFEFASNDRAISSYNYDKSCVNLTVIFPGWNTTNNHDRLNAKIEYNTFPDDYTNSLRNCTQLNTCRYPDYEVSEPETDSEPNSPGKPNDKYSGIETCSDVDIKRIKACGCIPAEIADITSKIYFILRIVGPVLLLILGGFDMAKAIATQDENAIEKAKKKLVNKFIAAAAIFLVLTVIEFVVGLLAKDATSTMKCIDILLNGYFI